MNIVPDSIVIASDEVFSFIVPDAEMLDALTMPVVPDDFPNESIRGLKIIESKITSRKSFGTRIMFRHLPNPKSTVKIEKAVK